MHNVHTWFIRFPSIIFSRIIGTNISEYSRKLPNFRSLPLVAAYDIHGCVRLRTVHGHQNNYTHANKTPARRGGMSWLSRYIILQRRLLVTKRLANVMFVWLQIVLFIKY